MRKATVISITLILTLIFSTISTFAAAWQKDPADANDPTLTVAYTELEDGSYEMKMYPDGIDAGKLDLNGSVYDIGAVYNVNKKIDDHNFFVCWLSDENRLYAGSLIGESSPGVIDPVYSEGSDGLSSDAIAPAPEKVWTATIELVPTNKRPAKSQITAKKIKKKVSTKINTRAYYINGKKVSKKAYNSAKKTGKYKVRKSKKQIRSTSKLVKTRKIFTDAEFAYPNGYEYLSEEPASYYSVPAKAVSYNFCLYRYYKVMKTYKIKYNLVRK